MFQAPCEAEASCAALVKAGKVFGTATEDMDGLTFGTNVLLRHLTASEAKYVYTARLCYRGVRRITRCFFYLVEI